MSELEGLQLQHGPRPVAAPIAPPKPRDTPSSRPNSRAIDPEVIEYEEDVHGPPADTDSSADSLDKMSTSSSADTMESMDDAESVEKK